MTYFAPSTKEARKSWHDQGVRFMVRVELMDDSGDKGFVDLTADNAHHAKKLAQNWIEKLDALTASTSRIFANGSTNIIWLYDADSQELGEWA